MRAAVLLALLALLAPAIARAAAASRGDELYAVHCATCHGGNARGTPRGPSLAGAGALAADFYLDTGRMPLRRPGDYPGRADPAFDPRDQAALVDFVRRLGGPQIPTPHPERGDLALGFSAFTSNCAGCHAIGGAGGVLPSASNPQLLAATPRQIAEAVRLGPYLMPRFDAQALDDHTLDSIIA